jgi:hypothetical protein
MLIQIDLSGREENKVIVVETAFDSLVPIDIWRSLPVVLICSRQDS